MRTSSDASLSPDECLRLLSFWGFVLLIRTKTHIYYTKMSKNQVHTRAAVSKVSNEELKEESSIRLPELSFEEDLPAAKTTSGGAV